MKYKGTSSGPNDDAQSSKNLTETKNKTTFFNYFAVPCLQVTVLCNLQTNIVVVVSILLLQYLILTTLYLTNLLKYHFRPCIAFFFAPFMVSFLRPLIKGFA